VLEVDDLKSDVLASATSPCATSTTSRLGDPTGDATDQAKCQIELIA
jgi:hypothetical protein